jgi:hypothetical protein
MENVLTHRRLNFVLFRGVILSGLPPLKASRFFIAGRGPSGPRSLPEVGEGVGTHRRSPRKSWRVSVLIAEIIFGGWNEFDEDNSKVIQIGIFRKHESLHEDCFRKIVRIVVETVIVTTGLIVFEFVCELIITA